MRDVGRAGEEEPMGPEVVVRRPAAGAVDGGMNEGYEIDVTVAVEVVLRQSTWLSSLRSASRSPPCIRATA